jgi:hypothetical protein
LQEEGNAHEKAIEALAALAFALAVRDSVERHHPSLMLDKHGTRDRIEASGGPKTGRFKWNGSGCNLGRFALSPKASSSYLFSSLQLSPAQNSPLCLTLSCRYSYS